MTPEDQPDFDREAEELLRSSGIDLRVATTPEDIITVVPHMLQMQPENALVILPVASTDTPVIRIDMPETPQDAMSALGVLQHPLATHYAGKEAVAIYYTDNNGMIGLMSLMLATILEPENYRAIKVYQGRYWEVGNDNPADPGHPYVATHIADGLDVPGFEDEVLARFEQMPSISVSTAVLEHMQSLYEANDATSLRDYVRAEAGWLRGRLADHTPLTDKELSSLVVDVSITPLFDVAWASLQSSAECRDFWLDAAARFNAQPDLLFLAAFACWLNGAGVHARILVDKALALESKNRPARMLLKALQIGMPPEKWDPPAMDELPAFKLDGGA